MIRFFSQSSLKRLYHWLNNFNSLVNHHSGPQPHYFPHSSFLFGLPSKILHRLQLLQNSAAHKITRATLKDHISATLHQLHWLQTPYRIEFKIIVSAFKCMNDLAPSYLSDLINIISPSHSLRSSTVSQLFLPIYRACAPTLEHTTFMKPGQLSILQVQG